MRRGLIPFAQARVFLLRSKNLRVTLVTTGTMQERLVTVAAVLWISTAVGAQSPGAVRGTVTHVENGGAVHGAVVLIVGPGLVALTGEQGEFLIEDVPAGTYEILAQREHLSAARQMITVASGGTTAVDFELRLSPIHEEVTVTATTGGRATTFEAFNATTTLDSFDLVENPVGTLSEALEAQPGIAKRGFGPGSSRPIIRGFDGDPVLVMEDGVRTGDLSSQSGDHGVTTDPNGLDRIEVVRGPATLLYGSNSIGGVINSITPHESFKESLAAGTRGQISVDAGSASGQVGTFASTQHARAGLMVWVGGGARRTGDYDTPTGTIENSKTRLSSGRAGLGYSGEQVYASGGFTIEDGRYGVPFAGALPTQPAEDRDDPNGVFVDLDSQRRVGRFDVGMRQMRSRILDSFNVVFSLIDWHHDEVEIDKGTESLGTEFDNRTYVVRADLNQRQTGPISGTFGVWSQFRDFRAVGEEALTPQTDQTAFAAFVYEELALGRYRLQLGGRVERNDYTVAERGNRNHLDEEGGGRFESPAVRNRGFTGASASVGVRAELGAGRAVVANLTRSHRAPALEELYNFGPHVGNLVFEIGNPDLEPETTLGLDVSLRHQSDRVRGDLNVYVYDIDNFIFVDLTDERVGPLRVGTFLQDAGRFKGVDAKGSLRLGSQVWANAGFGYVDAELLTTQEALPRIPPLQGSVSVDLPYRGLTVTPELVFASRQDQVFRGETETDGYSVFNLRASYVWPRQHMAHVLSVSTFNLTNELYRNHTSFIKDLAPEIGRGVRMGYSLRFF